MTKINTEIRQTTIACLAAVGFVALVGVGIWLAIYSTRFVPTVVNRTGAAAVYLGTEMNNGANAAAVYLGSIFNQAPSSVISSVSTSTEPTIISFGVASSTVSTTTAKSTVVKPHIPVATTAGEKTENTYQISGGTSTSGLSGLPDLVVNIDNVGYLQSISTDSFIASSTIPAGSRPAVKFTVKNIGTNVSGSWRFSASIPTQTVYIYQSQLQQPLNPGDSIDYTLGFDQSSAGANKTISITANFDHLVGESNTDNNSASTAVTILGS